MESIKTWFQDWSDACEYAKECAPDFSFLTLPEPWSAFAAFAAVCFAIWWWNERRLVGTRVAEAPIHLREETLSTQVDALGRMFDKMSANPAQSKRAA
jgi:hypothetical protein